MAFHGQNRNAGLDCQRLGLELVAHARDGLGRWPHPGEARRLHVGGEVGVSGELGLDGAKAARAVGGRQRERCEDRDEGDEAGPPRTGLL